MGYVPQFRNAYMTVEHAEMLYKRYGVYQKVHNREITGWGNETLEKEEADS
jgi:hypothetical protein